jgi:alkylation response protein AidB-like acyl-CoA dehydrogenase
VTAPEDADGPAREVADAACDVVARFDDDYWRGHCDRRQHPDELWAALAGADLLGLAVPEAYGGSGRGLREVATLVEALAVQGRPLFSMLTTYICGELLLRHGSDDQRARHLPSICDGTRRFAFAITEPDAGTNTFAIRTSVRPDDDGSLALSGHKCYISGLDSVDVVVVVARSSPADAGDRRDGMALVLVDPRAPGVSMTPMPIDMPAPERQFAVWFDGVAVAPDDVVGDLDQGFRYLFTVLNPERLLTATTQVGIGSRALGLGVARARERAPFGVPVGTYQAIAHPLARAHALLESARVMAYRGCSQYDAGRPAGTSANVAKLLAAEASEAAFDAAVQAHGGAAFDATSGLSALWPLVRMGRIGPVSNEMVLNHVAEHTLGLPKSY